MKDQGHWEGIKLNADKNFGFVYSVTNLTNGREYIGKKQFYSYKKTKRHKELEWRSYTGSSKYLNADINSLGIENFKFTALKQYRTKGWLTYSEANMQHRVGALTKYMPDGQRKYYNQQISAIRFIPKKGD